jgi:hypothetical protein
MAKLFLTNINLNTNELQFPVIHKLATAPTSPAPVLGQMYFNTTDKFLYLYDGTAWDKITLSGEIVDADIKTGAAIDKAKISGTAITAADTGTVTSTMIADATIVNADISGSAAIALSKLATNPLSRTNHTDTQLASTISNFDTAVRTSRLDQMTAPSASVAFNNQKITGLADPTLAQDAATKAYVDAARQGLDVKDSVKVASTANVALTGTQTIDTVSVAVGDRVLLKNQTAGAENGIWVVASGAWARADDANTAAKLNSGAFVFVEQGSQSDSGWVMTTDGTITLGTTVLAWAQFSGAGQIVAGAGLTKTGNTIDVATASTARIVVNADNIDLATVSVSSTGAPKGTSSVIGISADSYGRITTIGTATDKFAGPNPLLTLSGQVGTWTVNHNLGTSDVIAQVRQISNNEVVEADIEFTSTSVITVRLTAPSPATNIAADSYRIVVMA